MDCPTRRYSETDIRNFIDAGALVFSGSITDKFGDYGTVIVAIVIREEHPSGKPAARLDTFLMSCRVMGRGIECAFMDHVARNLAQQNISLLTTEFIPTAKNVPIKNFLKEHGFQQTDELLHYSLDVVSYMHLGCPFGNTAVKITTP